MSQWITLVTPCGRMNGWLAEPDDKPNGGIVLVHDVFGVNEDVRRIAERYAGQGYLTLVSSLFDKIRREVELDYRAENQQTGEALAQMLGMETAIELVNTAVDAIGHVGKIAVMGYGWGGSVALRSALALDLPWVGYYEPAESHALQESATIPALLHYGEDDPPYSSAALPLHKKYLPGLQYFAYPARGRFDYADDPAHFHPESAELALRRTLDFLKRQIRHEND